MALSEIRLRSLLSAGAIRFSNWLGATRSPYFSETPENRDSTMPRELDFFHINIPTAATSVISSHSTAIEGALNSVINDYNGAPVCEKWKSDCRVKNTNRECGFIEEKDRRLNTLWNNARKIQRPWVWNMKVDTLCRSPWICIMHTFK